MELPFSPEVVESFLPAKQFRNQGESNPVTSLAMDDAGQKCITAGYDGMVHTYDCVSGKHLTGIGNAKYGAHLARFTHRSDTCVYASTKGDDTIRMMNIDGKQFVQYFVGHKNKVTSLEICPTSNRMISAGLDRTVRIWDFKSRDALAMLNVPTPCQVAFDATGLVFAVASQDVRTVAFYDMRFFDKEPFLKFYADVEGSWQKAEFSNTSKHFVVASDSGSHGLYDGFTGKKMASLVGHRPLQRPLPSTSPVAFSTDGRFLFGGSGDPAVCIWDVEDLPDTPGDATPAMQPTKVIESPQQPALLAFSPKSMLLATADSSVELWLPSVSL